MPSGNNSGFWVAVWMVTYNHEHFLATAIESVLSQKTSFEVRLFIGEDFSKDNTRKICESYKAKYPDKIELLISDSNVGPARNALRVYERIFKSDAKFVAMLEGDDYWNDNNKLQKQVDFLLKNEKFVLCGHQVNSLEHGRFNDDVFKVGTFDIEHVIKKGRVCHTVSMLFRNVLRNDIQLFWDQYSDPNFHSGDRFLQLLLLHRGNAYVMNGYMAVYRKHAQGIMKAKNYQQNHDLNIIKLLERFNEYTNKKYDNVIESTVLEWAQLIYQKSTSLPGKLFAYKKLVQIKPTYAFSILLLPYLLIRVMLFNLKSK